MKLLRLIQILGLASTVLFLQNCISSDKGCVLEDPVCNPVLMLLGEAEEPHFLIVGGNGRSGHTLQINSEDGTLSNMVLSQSRTFRYLNLGLTVSPINYNFYGAASGPGGMIVRFELGRDGVFTETYEFLDETITNQNKSLAISPLGDFLFVNQYISSTIGNIRTFAIDAGNGDLSVAGDYAYSTARNTRNELLNGMSVNSTGDKVYSSNYLDTNIQGASIGSTGIPSALTGVPYTNAENLGVTAIHPGGNILYALSTDTAQLLKIYAYAIDSNFGFLTQLSVTSIPDSIGRFSGRDRISFDSTGKFMFLTMSLKEKNLFVFAVDETTGRLNDAPGSPYTAGSYPGSAVVGLKDKYLYVGTFNVVTGRIQSYSIGSSGELAIYETSYLENSSQGELLQIK